MLCGAETVNWSRRILMTACAINCSAGSTPPANFQMLSSGIHQRVEAARFSRSVLRAGSARFVLELKYRSKRWMTSCRSDKARGLGVVAAGVAGGAS